MSYTYSETHTRALLWCKDRSFSIKHLNIILSSSLSFSWASIIFKGCVIESPTDIIFVIEVKSKRCGVRPNLRSLSSWQECREQFTCADAVMLSANRPGRS